MININLLIDGLSKLDDSDKQKLNLLLSNAEKEFSNNPTEAIINALKIVKKEREKTIIAASNKETIDPRVIAYLNQKEESHKLFLDYAFIGLLISQIDGVNITSNSEYSKWVNGLTEEESLYFKRCINLFHNALYDYALHELCVNKKDLFNEKYETTWFNISFNNNVYRVSAHPNSELGTTCYKVLDLEGEEVINFDDVMNYYIKLKKEEEETQRKPKKEIEE